MDQVARRVAGRAGNWTRRVVATSAAVACVAGVGVAPASAADSAVGVTQAATTAAGTTPVGPAGDAFYTPPSPLPPGRPGDVIWYRSVTPSGLLAPTSGTTVYQVLYRSTDTLGAPDVVSGTVLIPKGAKPATTPIVAVAPGTQGLADSCAPSKGIVAGSETDDIYVNTALSKGWAVAVTDYQGLGTPGQHTYVVGRSEGTAVIDSVRAAQRLSVTGLSATAKVGFWGYSQGGGAVGWAGELQPTYAPEMNLVGISAGGVPGDLTAVAKSLDGGVAFGFLAMAAVGFDAAYPELHLASYLNANGATQIAKIKTLCLGDIIAGYAFQHLTDFVTVNPLTTPAWQARLGQNMLGFSPPKVPIFMYHGNLDEAVAFGQADALHKTYCKAGVPVTWNVYLGEHVSTFLAGQGDAVNFLVDRMAGKKTTGNC